MTFRLRPMAEADLERIALHIARDSPSAALRWRDEILARCRRLGEMPQLGVARPDIRPELRTLASGNYLILYRVAQRGVEIVRIVHGARRWEELI